MLQIAILFFLLFSISAKIFSFHLPPSPRNLVISPLSHGDARCRASLCPSPLHDGWEWWTLGCRGNLMDGLTTDKSASGLSGGARLRGNARQTLRSIPSDTIVQSGRPARRWAGREGRSPLRQGQRERQRGTSSFLPVFMFKAISSQWNSSLCKRCLISSFQQSIYHRIPERTCWVRIGFLSEFTLFKFRILWKQIIK